jgi:hypothetical protein
MKCFRRAGVVLGVIVQFLGGSALAASPVAPFAIRASAPGEGLRLTVDPAKLNQLWAVRDACEIDFPVSAPGGAPAPGEGEQVRLQMMRFEVIAPDAKFVRADAGGQMTQVERPQVLLLRGSIAGEPGSHAYLALTRDGGGSGSITRGPSGGGAQLIIGTDVIDPLRVGGGGERGLIVYKAAAALPDFPEYCGTITRPVNEPAVIGPAEGGIAGGGPGVAPPDPRGPRVITVALDGDQSYTQLFPSEAAAQAYMVQLIGAVTDIYLRELNFKLQIGFARTWPNGGEPFSASNLTGFRMHWINNEDLDGLNLVHMLSGRRDLQYGGIAFLADACDGFGFAISGFLLGAFPSPITVPHLSNWDVNVVAHEMGHNLGTPHTHDYLPPIDQCTSGVHERGTIMSYCHTNPGGLLNIDIRMHARVAQLIAANNQSVTCVFRDCNGNGEDDAQEIAVGTAFDNNFNGIPDSCEDCNDNGVNDASEIFFGAADVNINGVLDECEADCNGNGFPDSFDIAMGFEQDLNGDGQPDSCEPDCDDNGVVDFLDIRLGTHTDVDRDSIPDACQDCNGNGVVDWIDLDRQFNWFIGQATLGAGPPVREYHVASGVATGNLGAGIISGAYDLAFGPDRQLYVASFFTHQIIRIDVDAGAISTFVSAGAGGLASPSALAFGPDGHVYVSSQATNSVLRYDGQTGAFMNAFVTPGSGGLSSPWGLTFGPNGNLFVISAISRVLQYNGDTGAFVGTFVGGVTQGGDGEPTLDDPRDLTFLPNGHLLVTSRANNIIIRYGSTGTNLGQFNDNSLMVAPWGVTIGSNGNVYVARTTATEVRVIEYDVNTGRYIRAFVRGDGGLTAPTAFAIRPASPNDDDGNGVLDTCDAEPCSADIYPDGRGDGAINIDDLLFVINSWGPVAPGTADEFADIAPPGGDGVVSIHDLLVLLNTWGTCP